MFVSSVVLLKRGCFDVRVATDTASDDFRTLGAPVLTRVLGVLYQLWLPVLLQ